MAKNNRFDQSSKYADEQKGIHAAILDIQDGKGSFINYHGVVMWSPMDDSGFVFTLGLLTDSGDVKVLTFRQDNPMFPMMARIWERIKSMNFKSFPPPYNHTWSVKECIDGTAITHSNLLKNADQIGGSDEFPLAKRMMPDPFERMRRNGGHSFSFRF